jgi:hypothetical protein
MIEGTGVSALALQALFSCIISTVNTLEFHVMMVFLCSIILQLLTIGKKKCLFMAGQSDRQN